MKLKFKKGILLSFSAIALLNLSSCKEKKTITGSISDNDQKSINYFDQKYFAKYNVKFIKDTDDSDLWKNDIAVETENDSTRAFHTWAWQKYLHLTQNIKYEGGEKTKDGLPLFLDDDNIHQISLNEGADKNVHIEKYNTQDANLKLVLKEQAMSHAILKTNPAFSIENLKDGATVYYSIHMNQIMIDDITKSVEKKVKYFIEHTEAKSEIDSTESYTNGALELKAAWVNIKAIPVDLQKDYLIINNVLTPESKEQVSVALIGLHIVGMVKGFPELLWTTFEGKHLAPDNMHNLTDILSIGQYKEIDSKLVAKSDHDWMFYRKGKTTIENADNVITYKKVTSDTSYDKQVYRKYPLSIDVKHFSDTSKTSQGFVKHANLMNAMNKKGITHNNIKMTYNGNIWLIPGNKFKNLLAVQFTESHEENNKYIAGSPNAVNITMETYGQNTQCFSCHGGTKGVSGLKRGKYSVQTIMNTSHIYQDYLAGRIGYQDKVANSTQLQSNKKVESIIDYIERIKKAEEDKVQNN